MSEYVQRYATPDFIERAKTQTLTLAVYLNGAQQTVTSGTLTVYDGEGVAIVDEQAVSIDGNGGATYSLSAATVPATLEFSVRWREEWTLLVSGETHTFRRDAHLIRTAIYPVVADADMGRRHTDLTAGKLYPRDRTSWQHVRDEAWDVIVSRLVTGARWPYLIVTPWSLREPHLYLSLSMAFRELETFTNSRGRYAEMADRYHAMWERAWSNLQFEYDVDQDGDSDGREAGQSPFTLTAGNRRSFGWKG